MYRLRFAFLPVFAATLFLYPQAERVYAAERPNIIFILADDQAWWDYSFMYRPDVEGPAFHPSIPNNYDIYQVAQTPAIDRLADEGLTFTHGYTVPLCRPSLEAMITGTFPHQNRVSGNDFVGKVDDESADQRIRMMQSVARTLVKSHGYRAYQTGKWWGGPHHFGGFTEGDTADSVDPGTGPSQYTGTRPGYANRGRHGDWGLMIGRVDYVNDIPNPAHPINYANTIVPLTDFIDDCVANEDPFFVWYAPFLPHNPFDPPSGLRNKYDALIDEPFESTDWIARYYANIERLDGGVDAILDHLEAAGIADNTLIIFICDNGWITKPDTGLRDPRAKRNPADAGTRTPIIVHWPDTIKPGGDLEPQLITQPVSVIDMVPTALAAVGLEPSPEQRGVNLMDLSAVHARDAIYCDVYEHDMASLEDPAQTLVATFVVKDGWKLLQYPNGTKDLFHLYNTSTGAPVDPFETADRSGTETAKVAELSQLLDAWYDEPKDMDWTVQAAQPAATDAIDIPADVGQTFTVDADSFLTGIRIPLQQLDLNQSMTLELRALDASNAPTGALLGQATVLPGPEFTADLRWCLFPFEHPVPVTAGQQVGFQLRTSQQPNGGYRVAYHNAGGYSGGAMYYSGLIESNTWDVANLDLPFQTLHGNYATTGGGSTITRIDDQIYASAQIGVKGQTVAVQSTPDLTSGNWMTMQNDDNLDGLVAASEGAQSNISYRFTIPLAGSPFALPNDASAIYHELFDGTGITLNGVTPSTTTNATTWTASVGAVLLDDGTSPSASSGTAYLPFAPEHGFTYSLEVIINQAGSPDADQWVAFGFLEPNPSTRHDPNTGGSGILWALTRNDSSRDNQVLHENASGGTGSVNRGDYVTGSATVSMKLVLDTTQGSGNWTYDWIVNGSIRESDRPLSTAFETAIGSVGIAKKATATAHTFDRLKLTRD